jgi:hypothetical protein
LIFPFLVLNSHFYSPKAFIQWFKQNDMEDIVICSVYYSLLLRTFFFTNLGEYYMYEKKRLYTGKVLLFVKY